MKARRPAGPIPPHHRVRHLVAASLLPLLAACGGDAPPPEAPPGESAGPASDEATVEGVPAAVADSVAAVARPVATALVQTLSGNLQRAMREEGPVGAMEFCNVQAIPLTEQVRDEQGMEVKRTSWRLRNPANAPDSLERVALEHFASEAATGAPPSPWVQRDPAGAYRYYQPLPTAEACLTCHGSPDQLGQGVAEALERLYPEDEATGFALGELRGLLRVTVPSERIEPARD